MLFDEDDPEDVQRVLRCGEDILEYCIEVGGTITGEHGVGVEKLPLMEKMFNADTLAAFDDIKTAFDPGRRINDGKLIASDRIEIQIFKPLAPNTPGGAL
jgi:glycolate oxidase